uniref:hypothetical protein n=1 Tax=Cytobacillus oceanisediminis TaxID=665099 RepID=UPI001C931350
VGNEGSIIGNVDFYMCMIEEVWLDLNFRVRRILGEDMNWIKDDIDEDVCDLIGICIEFHVIW